MISLHPRLEAVRCRSVKNTHRSVLRKLTPPAALLPSTSAPSPSTRHWRVDRESRCCRSWAVLDDRRRQESRRRTCNRQAYRHLAGILKRSSRHMSKTCACGVCSASNRQTPTGMHEVVSCTHRLRHDCWRPDRPTAPATVALVHAPPLFVKTGPVRRPPTGRAAIRPPFR